jgi:ribulose-phosphate 3-epimerase
MKRSLIIAPSILAADFGRLAEEAKRAQAAGADWIHVDIMDGHFVPNISFGPNMVAMLRRELGNIPLDVHLMIEKPDRYVRAFAEAGADVISVHLEANHNVKRTMGLIRDLGCKVGLAINPPTALKNLLPLVPMADLIVCMTVNPGFGGQSFISEVLTKVRELKTYCVKKNLSVDIEVDGGINAETVAPSHHAGANVMVAGTSLFAQKNMKAAMETLRQNATQALAAG